MSNIIQEKTCWNCPAAILKINVNFRACGQSNGLVRSYDNYEGLIECARRPELGLFQPCITFEDCPEWHQTPHGYILREKRVLIQEQLV